MAFKDIFGQDVPVGFLRRSLERNRLGHAYLFCGQEGIGRFFTALNLAKTLNCAKGGKESCDSCPSCSRIDKNSHPDVKVLEPQGPSRSIKIESLRELKADVYRKPYEGKKKFYIIRQAERMNAQGANAFLKTLEEPPGETVFILISSFPEEIPPTIKSRCQIIRFSPISRDILMKYLTEVLKIPPKKAELTASLSGGSIGRAVDARKKERSSDREKIISLIADGRDCLTDTIENIMKLWEGEKERFMEERKISRAAENGEDSSREAGEDILKDAAKLEYNRFVEETLDHLILFLRDCLVYQKTGKEELLDNPFLREKAKSFSGRWTSGFLFEKINSLNKIKKAVAGNISLKLALGFLLADFRTEG